MPAVDALDEGAQLTRALARDPALGQQEARALVQRHAMAPRTALDRLLRLVAQTALGGVHHPLEGQVIFRADGQSKIRHRVAHLEPLVEARPADDAIGQTDRQEAILEGPHLVGRAHEDRHVVQAFLAQAPRPF